MKRLNLNALILILVLAITHSSSSAASSPSPSQIAEQVLPLLQGNEWRLDETRVQAFQSDAWLGLLEIASSSNYHNFIRTRAREVLTLYPNENVLDYFIRNLDGTDDKITKRHLAATYCRTFVDTHAEQVEQRLAPLLEHEDVHLRIVVARCFKRLTSIGAEDALRRYRDRASEFEASSIE